MGHDTLIAMLRRPFDVKDTARLRQALIEHNICHPPDCHPTCSVEQWFNSWPNDALAAALDFCRSAGVLD